MAQTMERLELPIETYHALEQMARFDGTALPVAVKRMVRERLSKQLRAFRREYQRLLGKEFAQTITDEEKQRMEIVGSHISTIEMQSEVVQSHRKAVEAIETRFRGIDTQLDELQHRVEALPDRTSEDSSHAVHS